jgi:hypothetical protein
MSDRGFEDREIWLCGNLRPMVGIAGVFAAVCAGLLAATIWPSAPASITTCRLIYGFSALVALVMSTLLWAASRPRLERMGSGLRVRLSPFRTHDVPLELVECFFLGSKNLAADEAGQRDDLPAYKTATLVIRIAERAKDWQSRPSFEPWGNWSEGSIVCDGRWCEPLSVDLARRLSGRLVEAKREVSRS